MAQSTDLTMAKVFHALAGETRQRLISALCEHSDGLKPGELRTLLGVGASTVRHHLHVLIGFGLVTEERSGRRKADHYYKACEPALRSFLEALCVSWRVNPKPDRRKQTTSSLLPANSKPPLQAVDESVRYQQILQLLVAKGARGMRVDQVASSLRVSQPQSAKHLKALLELGLIERRRRGNVRVQWITEAGREILAERSKQAA